MNIKITEISYQDFLKEPQDVHVKPSKQNPLLRLLVNAISCGELKQTNFKYEFINNTKIDKKKKYLILMNHTCFLDLKMVFKVLHNMSFSIVATDDGFVGKSGLLRGIGCIPTKKFLTDITLIKDMKYAIDKLNQSVLMYPEATYSFDGRTAVLPESLGKCIKYLNVPVLIFKTTGSFLHDPLYNGLQLRNVDCNLTIEEVLNCDQIKSLDVDSINSLIKDKLETNGFKYQIDNHIKIDEPFRADHLERILYKCPHCGKESCMVGSGTTITCKECGATYNLDEYGLLNNVNGKTLFNNIPDWYDYEISELHKDIDNDTYSLDVDCEIYALKNTITLYHIGDGHLHHDKNGFKLTGCNGELEYSQGNNVSYSLYSDYFWYELGDMICVGDLKTRYYCVFKEKKDIAAKARLAVQYFYLL